VVADANEVVDAGAVVDVLDAGVLIDVVEICVV
jgi:hypothetical protein